MNNAAVKNSASRTDAMPVFLSLTRNAARKSGSISMAKSSVKIFAVEKVRYRAMPAAARAAQRMT